MLTNGDSDLKKDSDKDEVQGDSNQEEEATSGKTEGSEVGQNGESVTTAALADAEDNEDSDVRKSVKE